MSRSRRPHPGSLVLPRGRPLDVGRPARCRIPPEATSWTRGSSARLRRLRSIHVLSAKYKAGMSRKRHLRTNKLRLAIARDGRHLSGSLWTVESGRASRQARENIDFLRGEGVASQCVSDSGGDLDTPDRNSRPRSRGVAPLSVTTPSARGDPAPAADDPIPPTPISGSVRWLGGVGPRAHNRGQRPGCS